MLVANDGVQDAAYIVRRWPEPNIASLGGISLVRGFKDPHHSQGKIPNVRPGDRYEAPIFAYVENPGATGEALGTNTAARMNTRHA